MDTHDNPFKDDVIHIQKVMSTDGLVFSLNDPNSMYNVNTPEFNCVQTGYIGNTQYLVVEYMAKHPKISLTEPLDSNCRVSIPSSYETVFQTYVACLLLQSMGEYDKSNALYAKFKTIIEELKNNGIGIAEETGINIKPQLGGWI